MLSKSTPNLFCLWYRSARVSSPICFVFLYSVAVGQGLNVESKLGVIEHLWQTHEMIVSLICRLLYQIGNRGNFRSQNSSEVNGDTIENRSTWEVKWGRKIQIFYLARKRSTTVPHQSWWNSDSWIIARLSKESDQLSSNTRFCFYPVILLPFLENSNNVFFTTLRNFISNVWLWYSYHALVAFGGRIQIINCQDSAIFGILKNYPNIKMQPNPGKSKQRTKPPHSQGNSTPPTTPQPHNSPATKLTTPTRTHSSSSI